MSEAPKIVKTITLKHPFNVGSEQITEIKFRRPKGKDLRLLPPEPATSDILDLAARIGGVPPSTIDEMDAEDVMEIVGVVQDFLPNSQKTGATQ